MQKNVSAESFRVRLLMAKANQNIMILKLVFPPLIVLKIDLDSQLALVFSLGLRSLG